MNSSPTKWGSEGSCGIEPFEKLREVHLNDGVEWGRSENAASHLPEEALRDSVSRDRVDRVGFGGRRCGCGRVERRRGGIKTRRWRLPALGTSNVGDGRPWACSSTRFPTVWTELLQFRITTDSMSLPRLNVICNQPDNPEREGNGQEKDAGWP